MKRILCILLGVTFLLAACASRPAEIPTPPTTRDEALEAELEQQLEAMNPEAVPLFQQGTAALDAGDIESARSLFQQVIELAPDFPAAYRRLSHVERYADRADLAVELARKAVELEPDSYNQSALSLALLQRGQAGDYQDAFDLASAAVDLMPDEEQANLALLLSASAVNDYETLRRACEHLVEIAPYNPYGRYFAGLIAAEDGRWEDAEEELLLARDLGAAPEIIQEVLDQDISRNALLVRSLRGGGITLAGWLAGLGFLYLVGSLLSAATLHSLKTLEPTTGADVRPAERFIRSLYRLVIAVLSAYYYLSIPMLVLGLLLAGAGLYYIFYLAGAIPVQLAVILGLVLFFSILAILRSVILRRQDLSPGEKLERADAPALWGLVDEVARKLQMPVVDTIYVTPYAEIAVNERGKTLRRSARRQRNLLIGMGVLPALTQGQFASALAHEYGHFYHGDTAGGNLAHKAYAALEQLAFRLAQVGLTRIWNPIWLFLVAYQRIFLHVTRGASRLREILADRYAAMAYGRQNFVEGLQNIVRQTIAFQLHADFEVRRSFSLHRPISNLYQLPMEEKLRGDLETRFSEATKLKTNRYDTHPALPERIALVDRLRIPYYPDQDNPAPTLDLLPNLDELQRRLTSLLMKNARR